MNIEQLINDYENQLSELEERIEQIQEETVNIEEKIYQALRKHKLPLKKREELMPDLLTLFSEILNKQK